MDWSSTGLKYSIFSHQVNCDRSNKSYYIVSSPWLDEHISTSIGMEVWFLHIWNPPANFKFDFFYFFFVKIDVKKTCPDERLWIPNTEGESGESKFLFLCAFSGAVFTSFPPLFPSSAEEGLENERYKSLAWKEQIYLWIVELLSAQVLNDPLTCMNPKLHAVKAN